MKRAALALLLALAAAPAAGQPALDELSVVDDSTLAWCGFVIGSPVEDLRATDTPLDFRDGRAWLTACDQEVVLFVDGGRLAYIEVTFFEEVDSADNFSAAVEARIGPVERSSAPASYDAFFAPTRVPGLLVKLFEQLGPEVNTMGLGFSSHFPDYMPGYRGGEEE